VSGAGISDRVQPQYGGRNVVHEPTPVELAAASGVLAAVPDEPAYARIDLVEGSAGPLLMEAELIEPFLFLTSMALPPSGLPPFWRGGQAEGRGRVC
jgi:hypothetical protein